MDRTVTVAVGAASLEIPESLDPTGEAVDSPAATWHGQGLSILVDQGAFADPLDSYVGLPDYQENQTEIDGLPARLVSYRASDDAYTVAVHVPVLNRLTVVVTADNSVPRDDAEAIIQSIRKAT